MDRIDGFIKCVKKSDHQETCLKGYNKLHAFSSCRSTHEHTFKTGGGEDSNSRVELTVPWWSRDTTHNLI